MPLINGPISPEFISGFIAKRDTDTASGAYAVFLGRVRADQMEGKTVAGIEYSAYDDMVESAEKEICRLMMEKHDQLTGIFIFHAAGIVNTGEISLFVMVCSKHRKQAFCASEETVELIKKHLPVWKKEFFDDGSYKWTENKV